MKIHTNKSKGHALITLLFFVAISTIVTTAAVIVLFNNLLNVTRFSESTQSYYIAESGIENALMQILRNPNYAGETLDLPEGEVVVSVTNNAGIYTINSTSTVGDSIRTVEAQATYTDEILTVTSMGEIY